MLMVKVRGRLRPRTSSIYNWKKLQQQAKHMHMSTETIWQVSLYSPACAEMLSEVMKFTAPVESYTFTT